MDIKSIKQIVNSDLPIDYQEKAILSILANDKKLSHTLWKFLKMKENKTKNCF